jgi:hypothetical protein
MNGYEYDHFEKQIRLKFLNLPRSVLPAAEAAKLIFWLGNRATSH